MGWSRLDLGVGVIALGALDQLWSGVQDLVDVVEVEPQTLWHNGSGEGRVIAADALAWLRGCGRPLLSHGVGYPVGGTTPPDPAGVLASARSAQDLGAVHWSEHLAFNTAGDAHAGFLLPPVQTPGGVEAAVRAIAGYQRLYDRPFLVETPTNYLRPTPGDLGDGQYVAAIAEQADCGILLDLHNLWTNERNGRQPVAEFLDALPLERVWEVHLAGGFEAGGYYLDAHVGPIDPVLLELAAQVVPRLPKVRALIYEAVPVSLASQGVEGLREVLASMHAIAALPETSETPETPGTSGTSGTPGTSGTSGCGAAARADATGPDDARADGARADGARADGRPGDTAPEREAGLLAYTTRATDVLPVADPGADLLRSLTDQSRLSLLVRSHEAALGALLRTLGRERTEAVLTQFLAATPASPWPEEQSEAFRSWLRSRTDLVELIGVDAVRRPGDGYWTSSGDPATAFASSHP